MARPIVLIHGMWSTGANFERLVEGLRPRGHACHAPTLPYHEPGRSRPEVGNISLRDYLSFLEDYVRRQNFAEPPILLGHATGGLLAQLLAARIAPFALVLLTPTWPAGISGIGWSNLAYFSRSLARWAWWRRPHKPSFHRAVSTLFRGVARDKHVKLYDALVEDSGRAAFETAFWWLDRSGASRLDPGAIRCPVYVVSCGGDALVPAAAVRKIAALYPQASLRHYPDRGHWVLDDVETDEMATEIANWLQGHEQRVAARGRE